MSIVNRCFLILALSLGLLLVGTSISSCTNVDGHDVLSQEFDHFRIVELAEGVWAAAHKDEGYAISNAGIIDTGDQTLIFDTFLTPEAALDLREAAETLTGRPATLVINSHFHNDHIRGNQVFRPEAEIIATRSTRNAIGEKEPEEIAAEKEYAPGRLAEVRADLTSASPEQQPELRMWEDYYEGMLRSHADLETTVPTITFDGTLTIHGPKRRVEVLAMGKGHTEDDAILYLPDDQIAFLGDLHFVERHPWLGSGDPHAWATTLRRIHGWDVVTVIPGHGPASPAASLLTLVEYIEVLAALVETGREAGQSEEEIVALPMPSAYHSWWYGRFYSSNLRHLYMMGKASQTDQVP